jgi:hypothetical protein
MSKDTATLVPAETLDLSAQPLDAKNTALSRTITWSSSNAAVATVVAGHVTAVAPGNASIIASAAGVTGHTDIVVRPGALIGPNGGTLNLGNGKVIVVFPIGTVASVIQLVVDSVQSPLASPRLVKGTAYSVESGAGASTLIPFTLTISYDPANLKTGGAESRLRMYQAVGSKWERIANSSVNTSAHTVSALVPGLGVYSILEEAPYAMEVSAGDKQTATVGNAVAIAPAVKIVDSEGFGVPGKIVQFAITGGNGSLTGVVDTTDNSGIASVGSWTLSSIAGANSLSATAPGVPGSPIQFAATGVAGAPLRLLFVTAPPATIANRTQFPTTTVRLVDSFGNTAPVSGVTVTAALTGGSGTLGGTRSRQTNAQGEVTYTDLIFVGSVGTKTVNFGSGSLTGVDASIAVTAGAPASFVAVDGENQSAVAGKAVATPPAVKITDVDGNPVSGISVTFSVTAGGGSTANSTAVTDASGVAHVGSWTLGSVAGENRLSATATGLSFSPVVFIATGNAGAADQLILKTAPTSPARNRIVFPTQPTLQLQDSLGNNANTSGLRVTASLVAGGGQLLGDTVAFTDASGSVAFTNLAIAGTTGPRTIRFSATGLPSTTVNVVLGAGTPATMAINAGDQQTATAGGTVFTAPSVIVRDADANPVYGTVVNFVPSSSSGQVTGGSTTTDSSGIARVGSWTLGGAVGTNTLTASSPDLPSTTLTFTATGTAGRAASISVVRGDGQTALAGRGVQGEILLSVLDAFGNAAANEVVNFVVSSGGTLRSFSTTTLSTGIAILPAWTLGPSTGTQTVTATVNGLAGQSAVVTANAVQVRIVTFGDSNTDYGISGRDPEIKDATYLTESSARLSPSAANSPLQLAGKIEQQWGAQYSSAITAVNHGVASTTTGTPRATSTAPSARTIVNNVTRFDAEVLGWGYPWLGGETAGANFPGQMTRLKAYTPTTNDFVYVSIGTNDAFYLIQSSETAVNLRWMIDRWVREGYLANHFILTTLAPIEPANSAVIPELNRLIRSVAAETGVQLIDIAAYVSNDDGLTWKDATMHVGDSKHYAESVRTWIAGQVVEKMASVTAAPN